MLVSVQGRVGRRAEPGRKEAGGGARGGRKRDFQGGGNSENFFTIFATEKGHRGTATERGGGGDWE